jgi:hypothetical protein
VTTFNADALNDIEPESKAEPGILPPKPGDKVYAQLADPDLPVDQDEADDLPDALLAELAEETADLEKPEADVVPGTTVALAERLDVSLLGEGWKHDWLEFKGDKLGIRLPQRQALAAFSLASSRYVDDQVKNDLTGLFIARHLSPESYGRVFSRLMDPDENDYTVDTIGELFNAIVTAAVKAF